ncbi:MAG: tRNA (guanosine(46)-N7)-methyltransferase TrmB [Buchnera aphidicola (Periphyllus lyropictus)]|uniref:tRNA (guanosine(46)-N7)-methyltransferase TrmB n=1 Tax=Buchnera aphidicola TaxID=9 RepID=UPI001EC69C6A|nr:tRNA (guanosine(46)-N7)-methyltransferase TrmB [Buchnera aphidicola]NIH16448.1 tRNA (guanosine(46)-N7)-methyltransferase TrmB [Buchnera aphidicola (Periphyllus lyropictus)]USS94733.1 tRNA (guanosine(46)-N7)-methyltransferase TrmB [Buchnera aphidicola (Periphyllus lyropictus)]
MNIKKYKIVKTFKIRNRKLSKKKKYLLNFLWPLIGINLKKSFIKKYNFFHFQAPIILEIGFGRGDSLIHLSKIFKNIIFLGIEMYIPGICYCLEKIYKNNLNNVKIIYCDFIIFLKKYCNGIFFHRVNIFFPDPWPKRKHYKRRIINKNILKSLFDKLILGGILHIMTDCLSYAMSILKNLNKLNSLNKISFIKNHHFFKNYNFFTCFKNKAKNNKKTIYEIIFQKNF